MADEVRVPPGFTIGHWTDRAALTGCTVILAGPGAVAGVDVRGAASSTFCTDTLRPGGLVERVHAVLLTGGSAYGLEAAGGVMRYLEEHSLGFEFAGVRVPIVVGAVIFDLTVGDPHVRPDVRAGYEACAAARESTPLGAVGAGMGARVAKGVDPAMIRPGGLGIATATIADATMAAVVVVNAVGGVWDDLRGEWVAEPGLRPASAPLANTVIGAVLTDAKLSREQANRMASVTHDGIARAIRPAHTVYDGDTMFCLAAGARDAPYDGLEILAAQLVAQAVAEGVRAASP